MRIWSRMQWAVHSMTRGKGRAGEGRDREGGQHGPRPHQHTKTQRAKGIRTEDLRRKVHLSGIS